MERETTSGAPTEITGEPRLPDFVGIGAMRCGTTTLWSLLAAQPATYLPPAKEIHFFDDRDGSWSRGAGAYAEHFRDAPREAVCGEITPSYMFLEEALPRIQQVLPDVRRLPWREPEVLAARVSGPR